MEMQELVDHWKLKQPVSYSARASMVKSSLPQLRWLMEMTDKSSLTILAPHNDKVATEDLLYVRNKLPKNRVLYDLHATLQTQFDAKNSMEMINQFKQGVNVHNMEQRAAVLDEDNTFRGVEWNVAEGDRNQKVYLGTETVVMQKGLLISKRVIKKGKTVNIYGRIEFFKFNTEKAEDAAFEVFLEATRRVKQDTVKGLNIKVTLSGDISINGEKTVEKNGLTSDQPCIIFAISHQPGTKISIRATKPKSCAHMPDKLTQETEGIVHLDMSLEGKESDNYHVAIRHNSVDSFVAVDQFRIDSEMWYFLSSIRT